MEGGRGGEGRGGGMEGGRIHEQCLQKMSVRMNFVSPKKLFCSVNILHWLFSSVINCCEYIWRMQNVENVVSDWCRN